jgi:hypothetical protein
MSLKGFARVIRETQGGEADLVRRVRVRERFRGETVWSGEVLVFKLAGRPTARRCYAWEVGGVVTVVLHKAPVHSARDAVKRIHHGEG